MDASIHDTFTTSTKLSEITAYLLKHPLRAMILRWNWKAASLSALLRASIYLFSYVKHGLAEAIGVTIALSVFRFLFGGVNGAIIQSYRRVQPAWHAVLTVPLLLAAGSHVMEFFVLTGYDAVVGTTGGKKNAILISVVVSIISAIFNLFAMRRGALIVRDESMQSFWRDLIRMPWLIFEFISFPLVWTYKRKRAKVRAAKAQIVQDPEGQES
jgi:hypothetical protein